MNTNKWDPFRELKSGRISHQSTIIAGNIYLISGSKNNNTEVIPLTENTKNKNLTISKMHNTRLAFGMCSFAGCVFVCGGYNKHFGSIDECEVYSRKFDVDIY